MDITTDKAIVLRTARDILAMLHDGADAVTKEYSEFEALDAYIGDDETHRYNLAFRVMMDSKQAVYNIDCVLARVTER